MFHISCKFPTYNKCEVIININKTGLSRIHVTDNCFPQKFCFKMAAVKISYCNRCKRNESF